ncbi:short chain dehydrogenase [Lysobacter sp. CAU 1642]|uniref:Short chain dehydrogenase n=2 Tax=Pseudomarimonas salicorniae TaxID=2933270 RepID=A0ABT0GLB9_9GAMM|nr:short chain dehydrogenase [Lysobacter sp. CAU 1642]
MKILIVGAMGTLGKAVAAELGQRHELVTAGRASGDIRLDLTDRASMEATLARLGPLDAVVSAAGNVAFGALMEMDEGQWALGLRDKLMGQVNLALSAAKVLTDGGSITLTTGVLAEQPIRYGAAASMVNAGVQGFVRAAALELPRGLRINAVSPGVLVESMPGYAPWFRGFEPVPAARAALGFSRSVEGADTGQVYRID